MKLKEVFIEKKIIKKYICIIIASLNNKLVIFYCIFSFLGIEICPQIPYPSYPFFNSKTQDGINFWVVVVINAL